jgi:hypothetical protein
MDHHGSWPILGSWPLGVPAICCQASKCERTRPGPRLRQETHGTWPNVGVLFNFVLLNHLCDAGKHRARMNLNNTHSNCRTCQSPLTVLVLPMVLGIITYSHLFLVTGGLDNAGPPVSKSSTTLPMFGVPCDVKSAVSTCLINTWCCWLHWHFGPGTGPWKVRSINNQSAEVLSKSIKHVCFFA